MIPDIRDKATIDHADVTALNFVRRDIPYRLRRHYRHGLRSHILEILDPADVALEQAGILVDGVRCFPRARPRRMFRIFRSRLESLDKALEEIGRVKTVERYLAPEFMATSVEVIVTYQAPRGRDLLLCGFQEHVPGIVFDPWTLLDTAQLLPDLYRQITAIRTRQRLTEAGWMARLAQQTLRFGRKIRQMMTEAHHIPDLAGVGNLIVTPDGDLRLVDINNISPVAFDPEIGLDEKGYPVCDKSVEALALIEEKITGRQVDKEETIFSHFFTAQRRADVLAREKHFWRTFSDNRQMERNSV